MNKEYEILLKSAHQRALEYLSSIQSRRVFPDVKMLDEMMNLDIPLPDKKNDPYKIFELLSSSGAQGTNGMAGPRYFGFVIGGALPVTVAANWMAAAWDQNCGMDTTSPVAALLEEISLKWLLDLFKLPPDCSGAFVTGATMAGFTCLASARSHLLYKHGWDVDKRGLFGAPPIDVFVSDQVHVTILKALSMLGFGSERLTKIPTDEKGRIIADGVPNPNGPTLICLQAGDVNTGCFDPFDEIIERNKSEDVWFHIDGAFGLWVQVSEKYKHLANGVEKADSWSVDAHKWLNVPYDSGIALVRHSDAHKRAMSISTSYLLKSEGKRQPYEFTPELSRRARGVEIWVAIASLGREGISEIVERCCLHAQKAAKRLSESGYEILNDVVINQVLVSFGSDERTEEVIKAIQEDGTCWCGGTTWKGRRAMRISISSWATTDRDMDMSLDAMIRIAEKIK